MLPPLGGASDGEASGTTGQAIWPPKASQEASPSPSPSDQYTIIHLKPPPSRTMQKSTTSKGLHASMRVRRQHHAVTMRDMGVPTSRVLAVPAAQRQSLHIRARSALTVQVEEETEETDEETEANGYEEDEGAYELASPGHLTALQMESLLDWHTRLASSSPEMASPISRMPSKGAAAYHSHQHMFSSPQTDPHGARQPSRRFAGVPASRLPSFGARAITAGDSPTSRGGTIKPYPGMARLRSATSLGRPRAQPPPDLVSAEDIPDDEMRALFREVQELSSHSSVGAVLQSKYDLKALFSKCSRRLTHLPYAVVQSLDQSLRAVPLPGPRGVLGYEVDRLGHVHAKPKRKIGPYLAASDNAEQILNELRELEEAPPEDHPGLEADPKLVELWRELGGSYARHHPGAQPVTADVASVMSAQKSAMTTPFMSKLTVTKSGFLEPHASSPNSIMANRSKDSLMNTGLVSPGRLNRASLTLPGSNPQSPARRDNGPMSSRAVSGDLLAPSTLDKTHGASLSLKAERKRQVRRRSSRIRGHEVKNINNLTGEELGFYEIYVKEIETLNKPEELTAPLHARFRASDSGPPPKKVSDDGDATGLGADGMHQAKGWMSKPSEWDQWDNGSSDEDRALITAEMAAARKIPSLPTAAPEPVVLPKLALPPALADVVVPSLLKASTEKLKGKKEGTASSRPRSAAFKIVAEEGGEGDVVTKTVIADKASVVEADDRSVSPSQPLVTAFRNPDPEEEVQADDGAIEAAWKMLEAAMGRGRRTKVRRAPITTASSTRQTPEPHATSSHPASRRVTETGPNTKRATKPDGMDEVLALGEAAAHVVLGFAKGWTTGTESGDTQVLSLARLKELLLEVTEEKSEGVQADPAKWGEALAEWLPTQEERQVFERLLRTAIRPGMRHIRTANEAARWLPDGVMARAAQPGSKVKLPPPKSDAPAIETARRYETDLQESSLVGKVPVNLSSQALARRLEQLAAVGDCQLDLAMAPRLQRADMGIVVQALGIAPHITSLRVSHGLLDVSGVSGLLALIKTCTQLKVLDVSHTPAVGQEAADSLGDLLHPRHKLNLTHLNLEGCPIQDDGFHALALGLQFNRQLQDLNLGATQMTDAALVCLDQVLEQNVVLSCLNLSDNKFTLKGITHLAKDLEGNVNLSELSIRGCQLDDACAGALARLLPQSAALQLLDMSFNSIGPAGAASIGEALGQIESHESKVKASSERRRRLTGLGSSKASGGSWHAPSRKHSIEHQGSLAPLSSQRSHSPGQQGSLRTARSIRSDCSDADDHPGPEEGGFRGCPLQVLLLHNNPLGMSGIMHLYKGLNKLQGRCHLSRVGLDQVTAAALTPPPGLDLWDPERPNGTHVLDLADVAQRQVASTLVSHAQTGFAAWMSAKLDGQPVEAFGGHLPPASWATEMPEAGMLQVKVMRTACMAAGAPAMSLVLERVVRRQLASTTVSDHMREALITCLTNITGVTAQQAAHLVAHIEYRTSKVDATSELLSCCVDVHNLLPALLTTSRHAPLHSNPSSSPAHASPGTDNDDTTAAGGGGPGGGPDPGLDPQNPGPNPGLQPEASEIPESEASAAQAGRPGAVTKARGSHGQSKVFTPEDVMLLLNDDGVQAFRVTPGNGTLSNWLHVACAGHYKLDLSQQVQRLVASTLLAVAAAHQHQLQHAKCPATKGRPGGQRGPAWSAVHDVVAGPQGEEDEGWKVVLETWNDPVPVGVLSSPLMSTSTLPHSGILELDLVLSHSVIPEMPIQIPEATDSSFRPQQSSIQAMRSQSPSMKGAHAPPVQMLMSQTSVAPSGGSFLGPSRPSFLSPPVSDSVTGLAQLQLMRSPQSYTTTLVSRMSVGGHVKLSSTNQRIAAVVQRQVGSCAAFEKLYRTCIHVMGMQPEDTRLDGWQDAASSWGGVAYNARLVTWREAAVTRYASAAAAAQQAALAEATGAVEEPETDAAAAGGKGKGKAGGKGGGKKSAKASASAAKEAARITALAAELRAAKENAALTAANRCMPAILTHAREHRMTALQVMHLLQLLPDMSSRLDLLIASRPALLDPAHTLDIVLSAATPAPLSDASGSGSGPPPPPLRPSGVQGAFQAAIQGVQGEASGGGDRLLPLRGLSPSPSASPSRSQSRGMWMVPRGAPGSSSSASGAAGSAAAAASAPAAGVTAASAVAAAAAVAGAATDAAGSVATAAQPATSAAPLLQLVAQRMGLGALNLPWMHPDTLQALLVPPEAAVPAAAAAAAAPEEQGLQLDMRNVEHIQMAMKLCRWCDMTRDGNDVSEYAALQGVWTDAGNLALEHAGTWSYWEQMLGWLCARPTTATADPTPPRIGSLPDALFVSAPPPLAATASNQVPTGSSKAKKAGKTSAAAPVTTGQDTPKAAKAVSAPAQSSVQGVAGGPGGTGGAAGPALGTLRLLWTTNESHQERAAVVTVQAVWRGMRVRRGLAAALWAEATAPGAPGALGVRKRGLPSHLLLAHIPLKWDPNAAALSLQSTRVSMAGAGQEEEEEEVEFVEPLLPVFGNTEAVSDAVSPPFVEPAVASAMEKRTSSGLSQGRSLSGTGSGRGTMAGSPARGIRAQRGSREGNATQLSTRMSMIGFRVDSIEGSSGQRAPHPFASGSHDPSHGFEDEQVVWSRVVRRWQAAWAVIKFWKRVTRLQRLSGHLAVAHAQLEMRANADHLFPVPMAEGAAAQPNAGAGGAVAP